MIFIGASFGNVFAQNSFSDDFEAYTAGAFLVLVQQNGQPGVA